MEIKRKSARAREYARIGAAFTAAVVCLVAILNVIIFALGSKYKWYFFEAENYQHTISNSSYELFEGDEEQTEIIFCMEKEEIEEDIICNLVWQTANQLAERHDFIEISNVNIYLQPKKLAKYKYTIDENGNQVQSAVINKETVIIANKENYRVLTLSDFFILNSNGVITSYNGEEVMLSALSWVQRETHPIAYFTNTHGENVSSLLAFYNVLINSGYDVRTIDLFSEKIDESAELIIMSNPIYDIERAADGSGIISEAEQLSAFLSRGGTLFVGLDPYIKSELTQLRAFLSEWGMETDASIIMDSENAISHDGYTLVTKYADSELGREIYSEIEKYNKSYTIVKDASPIILEDREKAQASAILTAYPSAKAYKNGKLSSDEGSFVLLAMAQSGEGKVILSSGAYLVANDVLNSEVYSNRELLFTLLEQAGCDYTTKGANALPIASNMLEGLTTRVSDLYATLLIIIIPLAVGACAFVVVTKRKNR